MAAQSSGALQRSAAASTYAELSKKAMADAYVSSESRRQLQRARAALGLGAAEAQRIEQDAAAVRIGAAAKKLLDKRWVSILGGGVLGGPKMFQKGFQPAGFRSSGGLGGLRVIGVASSLVDLKSRSKRSASD